MTDRIDPIAAAAAAKAAKMPVAESRPSRLDVRWITTRAGEHMLVHDAEWSRRYQQRMEAHREEQREDWKRQNGMGSAPAAPHRQDDNHD